ncbi:hypothetical protein R1sor_003200 [Riccia sorocarpa]|uniref:INO80 complex subunit B-like conserved region domain-containing protein n=1 Tax=Riccia sorocarpa TaxID=122646 RepID=A0ABD3H1Q2_9MARC
MGSNSSSDDEDEEQIARLQSVAVDSTAVINRAAGRGADENSAALPSKRKKKPDSDDEDFDQDGGLKYSQIRAQNLLHQYLDKSLGSSFVAGAASTDAVGGDEENEEFDAQVRLFSGAPPGINLKRPELPKQIIRPKRYESSDEDEPEKVSRLCAAAVESTALLSYADREKSKARARALKALEAAEKREKEEVQRVAKLRKERGEKWLPKVAAELKKERKLTPPVTSLVGRVIEK